MNLSDYAKIENTGGGEYIKFENHWRNTHPAFPL